MAPSRITPETRQRARDLRRNMTPPERALWRVLRQLNRSHGLHFRRQAPIGPYIADFVSFRHRLIVELDGDSHCLPSARRHDQARDAFLRQQGFQILRFSNRDAPDAIAETVLRELGLLPPPPDVGEGWGGGLTIES